MFLHVYVAYVDTMRLPNPGQLQDAANNQDAHGGHQIGDMSNRVCLLLVTQ
jgi:hypothetical protein